MSRLRKTGLLALATGVALLVLSAPAHGAYHLMKIREVHEGGAAGGDFIELQMYSGGQNFVGGHVLETYDGGGTVFQTFTFPTGVANGENQRTILVGGAPTVNGVPVDFVHTAPNFVVGTGGSACFIDTLPSNGIDCVTWGAPMSPPLTNPSPVGNPAVTTGLAVGQSAERSIARGCSTLLEAGDDTNNSAIDFGLAAPSPRNNATAPTERECVSAEARKCRGKTATIVGTNGRDNLRGTNKRDVIAARGGKDKVNGRGGKDIICGEGGKDVLRGGAGKDLLSGGGAADKLFGGGAKDRLLGQGGRDLCNGGGGNDAGKSCERPRRL